MQRTLICGYVFVLLRIADTLHKTQVETAGGQALRLSVVSQCVLVGVASGVVGLRD